MKKIGAVALTAILASSAWATYSVSAKEDVIQVENEEVKDASVYMKATGVITNIENRTNARMVTVENDEGGIMNFTITNDTLLFHSGKAESLKADKLEKGMKVEGYYDKNKPMILIYPPQTTPELFFVMDDEHMGNVKVGKFDENFLSLDKQLKLNIGEETVLLNQQGEKIKQADLKGKELVVFYSITTRSLPPQTPPTKIIVLDTLETEKYMRVMDIIDKDHYMKGDVKMIPLRKVAEELGYQVISRGEVNGAILTRVGENRSFTITRGTKSYGLNKSIRQFTVAPELVGGNKTYVSEEFLNILLGNE
ncbi:stalk domain-containing protein [Sporosarcina highlanderae]|uniref:Stalk domain-containing protein n=1 Tax=Sporosarcina highlanderae TaxID=3035916 RepID=A0ABT8JTH3_9BACL|nr:stalk domain-containing protein [Sporosarcina highlanderae]MDN4607846.1 stalk domain-containing protein [Sporosarcina highlanderae]